MGNNSSKTYEQFDTLQVNTLQADADELKAIAYDSYNNSNYEDAIVNFKKALTIYTPLCERLIPYESTCSGYCDMVKNKFMCEEYIGVAYIKLHKFMEASDYYLNLLISREESRVFTIGYRYMWNVEYFTHVLCNLVYLHKLEPVIHTNLDKFQLIFLHKLQTSINKNTCCQTIIDRYEDFFVFIEAQRLCLNELSKRSSLNINLMDI